MDELLLAVMGQGIGGVIAVLIIRDLKVTMDRLIQRVDIAIALMQSEHRTA